LADEMPPRAMTKFLLAFAAALFGATTAFAQTCKYTVPESQLVKKGTLTMSVNPTLPPMQYVDQTGTLKGMRVELGEEIAKRLCLKAEYVRVEFSAMIPGMQAGRWDMINTGIFYTDERAKLMQMLPYEYQSISISTAKGNPAKIVRAEDLAGKAIGVELGGFEERKTHELDKQLTDRNLKGMNIRTFENFAMAFQSLRAGQVEAALSIDATAAEYQKRGDFERVLSGLFPTPVALALKNRLLAETVAKVLNDMRADGSLQKLFNAYSVKPIDGVIAVKGPST
jgi:polar amino acid transport system substrate-binding protein